MSSGDDGDDDDNDSFLDELITFLKKSQSNI